MPRACSHEHARSLDFAPETLPLAENPLLPNAELRALLELTRSCANLDALAARKSARLAGRAGTRPFTVPGPREALLAGTAMQLRTGDLLVNEPGDATALALALTPKRPAPTATAIPEVLPASAHLQCSVAMAAALRATGSDGLVLQYARAGSPQHSWAEALAWAQQLLLPWILVCADARGAKAFSSSTPAKKEFLTWTNVHGTAAKLQLPILTVDGEDAVAVYRVMQESVLRARAGGGPAILWAMLPSAKNLALRSRAEKPVGRLERYLKARKIDF